MRKAFLNIIFNEAVDPKIVKKKSRRQDVKILRPTDCSVIGLKLDGSFVSPFLWIKMVQAFFHSEGTKPEDQTILISSVKKNKDTGSA